MIKLRSISSRLIVTYIVIAVLTAALLLGMFAFGLRTDCANDAQKRCVRTVNAIRRAYKDYYTLSTAGEDFENRLEEIADFQGTRIWVYDKYGVRWFDVNGTGSGLGDMDALLEESFSQLSDDVTHEESGYNAISDDDILSTPILTYTAPLKADDSVVGYAAIHIRVNEYSKTLKIILKEILYCCPVMILIALLMIFWAARSINRPLNGINAATKEIARGNFKNRIEGTGLGDVGGIVESFNYMAEELEKYEHTRESFVGNVSHELRSPLTSIQGFVQGMLDGTIEECDRQQYLETVLSETKRMNALINDLLDLAKYESGQFPMNFTRWDINELIRQCFISFITKIEDKSLDVTVNIPEEKQMVMADKDRITQVLTNLIDNAVKFCEPGGELKIWTHRENKKTVQVSISNTGRTIPEEDLPYVFDRFFKVDKSHNRQSPGTGIGLSIVRTIIQQHGQRIWVSSKRGTGTVFTFTLSDEINTKADASKGDASAQGGKHGRK